MDKTKQKPFLRAALFCVGAVFLLDPTVAVLDPLPDLVGYLLWMQALAGAECVIPYFAEARQRFSRMAIVAATKLPAAFILLLILGKSPMDRPLITVFSFGYAIVEGIFLVGGVLYLFRGFAHICDRFLPTGQSRCDGVGRLSVAFFACKIALSTLPEFLLLGSNDSLSSAGRMDFSGYFGVFAVLAALLSLGFGIVWFVHFRTFVRTLCREGNASPALQALETEQARAIKHHAARRQVSFACGLLCAAALLSCNLWLDNRNLLPDFFMGAVLLCLLLLLSREDRRLAPAFACCGAFIALSAAATVPALRFAAAYDFHDIGRKVAATNLYRVWLALTVAQAAAFLGLLVCLGLALKKAEERHTGILHTDGRLIPFDDLPLLRRRRWFLLLSGGVAEAFTPLYLYLLHFTQTIGTDNPASETHLFSPPVYGGLWMAGLVLSLLFFLAALLYTSTFRQGAQSRYPR